MGFEDPDGKEYEAFEATYREIKEELLENCNTGACECMSDATKKKITNMQVGGKDGDVELKLSGEIAYLELE